MSRTCYLFDKDGYFFESYEAQESPREPGVFLTPKRSTDQKPPTTPDGKRARWDGQEWSVEESPKPAVNTPTQWEIDAAEEVKRTIRDAQAVKSDAKFQSLISWTPAQAKQWAQGSFPSLTQAEQKDLGTLAAAISILGRYL